MASPFDARAYEIENIMGKLYGDGIVAGAESRHAGMIIAHRWFARDRSAPAIPHHVIEGLPAPAY